MKQIATVRTCTACGEDFADSDFDVGYPPVEQCGPCRRGEPVVKSDMDECYCGDYRKDHNASGCKLNGLGHGGSGNCRRFLLSGREGWRDKRKGVTFV